jgi:hypothetical protein
MGTRTFVRAALLATLIAGATVPPAPAFDLTGHWVGKWTCKGFDGAKFKDENKTSTLDITQSGAAIHAMFEQAFVFDGVAIPDAAKPEKGEVVLLDCHTNNIAVPGDGNSEVIRASVATKAASTKAAFKGVSILENNVAPFGEQVQRCKYAYLRVSTNDLAVGTCP